MHEQRHLVPVALGVEVLANHEEIGDLAAESPIERAGAAEQRRPARAPNPRIGLRVVREEDVQRLVDAEQIADALEHVLAQIT